MRQNIVRGDERADGKTSEVACHLVCGKATRLHQQCAYASHAGEAGAVWPPHGDSDLPLYGIDTVLFRMNQANGNHSRLSVFNLLGRVVDAKPAKPDALPTKVDLRSVKTIAALADIVKQRLLQAGRRGRAHIAQAHGEAQFRLQHVRAGGVGC